jgi:hypothetical protein
MFQLQKVSAIEYPMIDSFDGKNLKNENQYILLLFYRYKIIDSVRSKLYPHGSCTKENAAYICNELHIDNDVVYGNTKLFIRQP